MKLVALAVTTLLVGACASGSDGDLTRTTAITSRVHPGVVQATRVIDGDTIEVSTGTVRLIGIDTPERGMCGFEEATNRLEMLIGNRAVALVPGAKSDRDRHDRLLRYVETIDGVDVGAVLIEEGLAVSRYDSRDGYGEHDREDQYISLDQASPNLTCGTVTTTATTTASTSYRNCDAARAAGAAPVLRGDPGYGSHLDRDNDGVGCE